MEIKPFIDDIDTMEYIKSLIEIANTQNIGFLNNFYENDSYEMFYYPLKD